MENENSIIRRTSIWIDSSKAILIDLKENESTVEIIPSGVENRVYHQHEGDKGSFGGTRYGDKGAMVGSLRLDNNKKFAERRQHQIARFLDTVIYKLKDADQIAILGPAQMKNRLSAKLSDSPAINSKVTSVDPSGKLTNKQLIKRFREIFELESGEQKP